MKRTIKRLIGVVATIGLIFYGIIKLGYWLRPVDTDIATNAIDTFHNMPEDVFEVIGYGSSHMWRGMNAMELYNKYGIGSYNYGCNWQKINTTQLFLEDSLKTQRPRVALIETFNVNCLELDMNIDGEIYYTTAIAEGTAKQRYLKQCFRYEKERYLSYYMPLCAFHDNWINLTRESFQKDNTYTSNFYKTMGFVESTAVKPVNIPNPANAVQYELNILSLQTLDNIVSICKENGVDIIFYTAPWEGEYNYSDAMKEYAANNGYAYFNLFEYIDDIGIDSTTDFSDEGHLNTRGATKVADFLGNYLVTHYDLTDFRNIDNNLWEHY